MTRGRVVDLERARRALARLDALAERFPRLRSPDARERLARALADEAATPMENLTMPTVQVAFRLDPELVDWIDSEAERITTEQPGMKVTRVDVVRMILTRAKDAAKPRRKGR